MCFIDLQKAYDCAERELLRQVLTHLGVPAKMHAAHRQFYGCMRACVRTDNGEHSESSLGTKGLRQGCVLSMFVLTGFFSAAIHVAPVHFGQDEAIARY